MWSFKSLSRHFHTELCLSVSTCYIYYHISSPDLLSGDKHINKLSRYPTNIIKFLSSVLVRGASSKLAAQFSSLISVEDMADMPQDPHGPDGWPLTSNHSWWEAGRAAMSSWLCHISHDRVWPRGGLAGCCLTKRPKKQLGVGIRWGNEPERVAFLTGRYRTTRKGWACKHAFTSAPAGWQPAEADVSGWFDSSDARGGYLEKGVMVKCDFSNV